MRNHRPADPLSSNPFSVARKSTARPWLALARIAGIAALLLSAGLHPSSAQTTPPITAPPAAEAPAASPPSTDFSKPSADASGGQLRDLEARPVLRFRGQSTWDEGFAALRSAIDKLALENQRLGLAAIDKPMAYFLDSDDVGFTYEVYQPLGTEPGAGLTPSAGMDFARSPAGRVMVFVHEGAYDDIDSAYEAITAWLDEKGLSATGKFMEEYVLLPEKADDLGMKLNIYVFLK